MLLGKGHLAASTLIADALDVRHRLPGLWAAVTAGEVRVWQARHVASRTRVTGLARGQARQVDAQTTPYLPSLPWGRFLDLLEAKIITADPAAAEARREAAELDRFVTTGQSNEHGLKTLIAKATAGEVIYLVAMVDRIAQILLLDGDTSPVGVRRSMALGILAHPTRALELLNRHAAPEPDPSVEPVETPSPRTGPTDPAKLLPPAALYLHVSREAIEAGVGVARMEGVGPITLGQASEFLRHSHVTIRPVIDFEQDHPVDGYEVPDRMRDQLHLRSPASVFPWSSATSRRMEADHTIPYCSPNTGGPPGQSRIGNLGKLGRHEHRVKTHGPGWTHRQPQPGVHEWRTPTGYHFRVDHTGTHPLGTHPPAESAHERAFAQIVRAGR